MAKTAKNELTVTQVELVVPVEVEAEKLSPELKAACEKLAQVFNEAAVGLLKKYRQAGMIVAKAYKQAEKLEDGSGNEAVKRIAETLGINPRTLYNAIKVVDQLTTEQFDDLAQHPEITWSHVVVLADISHDETRGKFRDRIVEEKMSVRSLLADIRQQMKKKPRGPGRPKGVPASAGTALRLMFNGFRRISSSLNDVWLGERYDLVNEISALPAKKLTSDLRNRAEEAIAEAETLVKQLPGHIERLREGLQWIDAGLNDPEEEPGESG